MIDSNDMACASDATAVEGRSPRLGLICFALAAMLAIGFGRWLLAGGSGPQPDPSALTSAGYATTYGDTQPHPAVAAMLQAGMPGRPLAANPLNLADPAHDQRPLRFERRDPRGVDQIAIFRTPDDDQALQAALSRWHDQLKAEGWRGPLRVTSSQDAAAVETLRYDRGDGAYVWIRHRPTGDGYHDLVLVFRIFNAGSRGVLRRDADQQHETATVDTNHGDR